MPGSKNTDLEKELQRKLYRDFEAAYFLAIKTRTLALWRSNGAYDLPFVRVGRSVRYAREDLEAFIARYRRPQG